MPKCYLSLTEAKCCKVSPNSCCSLTTTKKRKKKIYVIDISMVTPHRYVNLFLWNCFSWLLFSAKKGDNVVYWLTTYFLYGNCLFRLLDLCYQDLCGLSGCRCSAHAHCSMTQSWLGKVSRTACRCPSRQYISRRFFIELHARQRPLVTWQTWQSKDTQQHWFNDTPPHPPVWQFAWWWAEKPPLCSAAGSFHFLLRQRASPANRPVLSRQRHKTVLLFLFPRVKTTFTGNSTTHTHTHTHTLQLPRAHKQRGKGRQLRVWCSCYWLVSYETSLHYFKVHYCRCLISDILVKKKTKTKTTKTKQKKQEPRFILDFSLPQGSLQSFIVLQVFHPCSSDNLKKRPHTPNPLQMCVCVCLCLCFCYLFRTFSGISTDHVRTSSPHGEWWSVLMQHDLIPEVLVKFMGKVWTEVRLRLGLGRSWLRLGLW